MSMLTYEKLQSIAQKTKNCSAKIDGEQCEFVIGKMKASLAEKADNVSPFEMIASCLIEPKLTQEQIKTLSVDVIKAITDEIGIFNGVNTEVLEKN
jgi:hypothetical protein